MSEEKTPDVMGALPRSRPHRRSEKRATASGAPPRSAKRLDQPAQPAGAPRQSRPAKLQTPPAGRDLLGTAVQAAAELAEIGLSVSVRALRGALSRLPRP